MNYSTRTADAVHILVLIDLNESDISSAGLAKSIATNPAHIRKLMAQLKKAGLIDSKRGIACPSLTRKSEEITLWDIYQAMEGDKQILHLDTHTNPECHAGIHIQLALQDYYDNLQNSFQNQMNAVTLANIVEDYKKRVEPDFNKMDL